MPWMTEGHTEGGEAEGWFSNEVCVPGIILVSCGVVLAFVLVS